MDSTHGSTTPVTDPLRRRTLRRRLAVATVVLVGAVGATFVWWGNPRLGEGGLVGPGDGMSWANDGVEDTRMVVRGRPAATVRATFSIRNDGRLPFTVHGLDVADMIDWFSKQRVTFVPGAQGLDATATPVQRLTLGPGEEATVLWSLDMACQPGMSEGSYMTIDALRFKLRWLGIGATRELPLERPITFVGDDKPQPPPSADCTS